MAGQVPAGQRVQGGAQALQAPIAPHLSGPPLSLFIEVGRRRPGEEQGRVDVRQVVCVPRNVPHQHRVLFALGVIATHPLT